MHNFQVFQITAPSKTPLRGDTEYAATLSEKLRAQGVDSEYLRGLENARIDSQAFIQEILTRRPSRNVEQIIHLQLRPPHGGTVFTPHQLEKFDHTIVTVHEFSELPDDEMKRQAIQYMKAAQHVVFTTPHEERAAAAYLPDIRDKSSIIPVFSSTPPVKNPWKRSDQTISWCSAPSAAAKDTIR